jgi:hypothetical protein
MPAASGTVVAGAAFAALTAPDALPGFESDYWVFRATVGTVDVSFDGVNVALTLANADGLLQIETKRKALWVRQNGGAATLRWSSFTKS